MPLSSEEKARLDELRSKDQLTEEEKSELSQLEANEPEDSDQDEYDSAWDNDNFDDDSDDTTGPNSEEDNDDSDNDGDSDDDMSNQDKDSDGTVLNTDPDDESDSQDTDADDDAAQDDETPEVKIARLEAEMAKKEQYYRSWEGRLRKQEEELKKGKKEGQGDSDKDASLDDDDPELNEFFEEFPDLKGPISKLIAKEAKRIVTEEITPLKETVGTVRDTLDEESDQKHYTRITEAHPDWKKIVDSGALFTWINRQPRYLQPRLNEIIESGNTEEVIELLDSYKSSTRVSSKNQTSSSEDSSRRNSKSEKAQQMEAVPSSSAGPRKPKGLPDKDDFDASWNHFTKEDKKN